MLRQGKRIWRISIRLLFARIMLIEMAWWVCLTFFQTRRYRFWATRLSLSELDLPSDLMPVLVFFWLGRLGRSGGWSECLAQTFTRILEWTSGLGVVREVGA